MFFATHKLSKEELGFVLLKSGASQNRNTQQVAVMFFCAKRLIHALFAQSLNSLPVFT
jgi:hypothetical protein